MSFELMPLPYATDAFRDVMSSETLTYHHDRHHQAYVDQVNDMLANQPVSGAGLVEIVRTARQHGDTSLFNSAAQVWNHNFFWLGLSADRQRPSGRLAKMIEEGFGSLDGLIRTMASEAVAHFSNGWVWLVLDGDVLKVISLHDADTPIAHRGMKPLLALDVWEHAYYIDYRHARAAYAERILGGIINWAFAADNLDGDGARRADQQFLQSSPRRASAGDPRARRAGRTSTLETLLPAVRGH